MTLNTSVIKSSILAVTSMLLLSGCGTVTSIVPDAKGMEHISAIGLGCNKPYKFTQECSGFSGATKLVEVSEFQYKIAGSEDGTIVLMMGAKQMSDAWTGKSTETANVAYEVTKKYLSDNGIRIDKVEPVSSGSLLAGYIITTDGNAYEALSQQSVGD